MGDKKKIVFDHKTEFCFRVIKTTYVWNLRTYDIFFGSEENSKLHSTNTDFFFEWFFKPEQQMMKWKLSSKNDEYDFAKSRFILIYS